MCYDCRGKGTIPNEITYGDILNTICKTCNGSGKTGDKINPDNECAGLYKEIEFSPKALDIMMEMQLVLQEMYGQKRGTITPKSNVKNILLIKESIYHFTCFTIEYYEMTQKHNELHYIKKTKEGRLELEFEIIDMWHFLMNIFLYSGILKFKHNLEFYYSEARVEAKNYDSEEHDMRLWWDLICKAYGRFMDSLPYKSWKTYKNIELNLDELEYYAEGVLRNFFGLARLLGITKEKFYGLYVAKNKENLDRQNRGY